MAKVVVIGAGFAGNTAALYLGQKLGKQHEVTMINRLDYFGYVPSWVWVGIGIMKPEKTTFPLAPVYQRKNIHFIHGRATEIHPDEGDQYVIVEREDGSTKQVEYDYLLIATGPKLNFEATPGLGPKAGNTHSICSLPHAIEARERYLAFIEEMKQGRKVKIVFGTGHPGATCQGAAFEYLTNIHKDLLKRGLREQASLHWLSNEPQLGDFGVRGLKTYQKGKTLTSEAFTKSIFTEFGITMGSATRRSQSG